MALIVDDSSVVWAILQGGSHTIKVQRGRQINGCTDAGRRRTRCERSEKDFRVVALGRLRLSPNAGQLQQPRQHQAAAAGSTRLQQIGADSSKQPQKPKKEFNHGQIKVFSVSAVQCRHQNLQKPYSNCTDTLTNSEQHIPKYDLMAWRSHIPYAPLSHIPPSPIHQWHTAQHLAPVGPVPGICYHPPAYIYVGCKMPLGGAGAAAILHFLWYFGVFHAASGEIQNIRLPVTGDSCRKMLFLRSLHLIGQ